MALMDQLDDACKGLADELRYTTEETPENKWKMKLMSVYHGMKLKEEEIYQSERKRADEVMLEELKIEESTNTRKAQLQFDEKTQKSKELKDWIIDAAKVIVPPATGVILMFFGWRFEQHDTYGSKSDQKVRNALSLGQLMK